MTYHQTLNLCRVYNAAPSTLVSLTSVEHVTRLLQKRSKLAATYGDETINPIPSGMVEGGTARSGEYITNHKDTDSGKKWST